MATEDKSIMIMSEHHASDCHKWHGSLTSKYLLLNLLIFVIFSLSQNKELEKVLHNKTNDTRINRFHF